MCILLGVLAFVFVAGAAALTMAATRLFSTRRRAALAMRIAAVVARDNAMRAYGRLVERPPAATQRYIELSASKAYDPSNRGFSESHYDGIRKAWNGLYNMLPLMKIGGAQR